MLLYYVKYNSILIRLYCSFLIYFIFNPAVDFIYFLDTITKVNLNLPCWDTLYILWTNISYLYLYLIPFLFLTSIFFSVNYMTTNYLAWVANIVIWASLLTLFSVNTNLQLLYLDLTNNSNFLLVNSVNKYHPFILHVSLNFFFIHYFSELRLLSFSKPRILVFNKFMRYNNIFLLCYITMLLGSWWAYQEGSWGGWWAWDQSEVFGLVILTLLAIIMHYNFFVNKFLHLNRVYKVLVVLLFFTYSLLQSNFGITSHNFGLRDESNFIVKSYYIFLIFFSVALLIFSLCREFKMPRLSTKHSETTSAYPKAYLFLFMFIVCCNLFTLVTDIFWKTLTLNLFNYNINYPVLLSFLLLIIILWYSISNLYIVNWIIASFFLFIFNPQSFFIPLIFFFRTRLTLFIVLHSLLLQAISISIFSYNYYWYEWIYLAPLETFTNFSSELLFSNFWFLSYPFFDKSNLYNCFISNSAATSLSSTADMPLFSLGYSLYHITQIFLSDNGRLIFLNFISDNSSVPILLISWVIFLIATVNTQKKYVIKC